jgi:putative peptidoglycan lipid II flippase
LVGVLFERGALSPADTAATASILTASILRIYALGLLGQTLVNIAVLPLFSIRHLRPTAWYPARAALAGLVVTAVVSLAALPFLGVQGLAAGNAAGISVLALLLLRGTDKYVGLVDVGAMKVVPRSVRGAPTERLESLTRRTGGGVRTERKGRSP